MHACMPHADTYQAALVKAVGRMCEEGRHALLLVDAPLMRMEPVRQLAALAQVGGGVLISGAPFEH